MGVYQYYDAGDPAVPTSQSGISPTAAWATQAVLYSEYWRHFKGDWLAAKQNGESLYPLALNVYRLPVMLHAAFLFGEQADNDAPLVDIVITAEGRGNSRRSSDEGRRMSEFVRQVWQENYGRSIMTEAGIISQVLGGCVFGLAYDHTRLAENQLPIRIDNVLPDFFFPVWNPIRYYELLSAFIRFQIDPLQAKALYGITTQQNRQCSYEERWERDEFSITLDGKVITYNGSPLSGAPLGGFVPYTYIPHPPRVGQFYGESLLKDKMGLAIEINDRMTDLGDSVAEAARDLGVISNATSPTVRRISGVKNLLDLGQTRPGSDDSPNYWAPSGANHLTESSVTYVSNLLNLARLEAYTPPALFGMDEGSQRSAVSLAFRMIPLTAHIQQERSYWAVGLEQLARRMLRLAAIKGIEGITQSMVDRADIHCVWQPILPRDAEAELNRILLQVKANLMSPQTAMEQLGNVTDIETELVLIKGFLEEFQQLQAQERNSGGAFEGGSAGGGNATASQPKEPVAEKSTDEETENGR